MSKAEIQKAKPESNPGAEIRVATRFAGRLFRISLFGLLSDFGLRVTDFNRMS